MAYGCGAEPMELDDLLGFVSPEGDPEEVGGDLTRVFGPAFDEGPSRGSSTAPGGAEP